MEAVPFFIKKMFRGTLILTQENRHFIVQIGKNKCSKWAKLPRTCITSYYTAHNNFQTKIFTFSRQIHKIFRGTRTPASPQKKGNEWRHLIIYVPNRPLVAYKNTVVV
jgi:hypothetical protein